MKNKKKAVVPRLRFPEFREAGEWKFRRLAKFVKERNQFPKEKLPLYSLTIEDGIAPKTERYERSFLVKKEEDAYKLVRPEDFAYNPMNLRFGAIARHSGLKEVAVSKYYNIFYCDGSVDSRFCEIYFRSPGMIAYYDDVATGSLIEKRRVHFSEFIKFDIRFPPLEEQQKIAACFFSLDALIAAQADKLDVLKTHKKWLMQQLFPREGETVPRLRFPEFREAGEWEMVPLGKYYGNIRNGFVGTATPHYVANGIPYLQGKNIKQGRIDATGMINISSSFHQAHKKSKLRVGDILMVQSGHVGECAMVEQQFSGGNCHALIVLSPEVDVHSAFFVHYFYSPLGCSQIFEITTGNTIKHILASDVRSLNVCVPKLEEQQKIAACLSSLDALIAAQAEKLDALKTHKKGLMQQLFPRLEA